MTPIPVKKDTAPPALRSMELHQRTPICLPCRRNYRCLLNGILVRLGPDAIIDADLYQCPACGHQIVRGFACVAGERYGPHKDQFAMNNIRMGDATITDHTGQPIDVADTIPYEDAAEAAASQDRW